MGCDCGRDQEQVDATVTQLSGNGERVMGVGLDVRNGEAVQSFFQLVEKHLGGLDILVNNAGVGIFGKVSELTFDGWRATLDTNLSGVFYCCQSSIPMMQKRGGGSIFNISSLAGRNAFAGGSAYNASKFGLNGFSEALMLDHRYDGIRVTSVMPGSVDTQFQAGADSAPWKIAPQDIADVILSVLRLPERTTISRIEMRPSLPPK
ncbi:MAG: SDR family NAD(P)-dependent oxidoreductase [Bryobacteraceae bacterium]